MLAVCESAPLEVDQSVAAFLLIPTVDWRCNLDRVMLHTVAHSSALAQAGAQSRPDQC